jgi:drug/metabolite transporter (DMT)-like permease
MILAGLAVGLLGAVMIALPGISDSAGVSPQQARSVLLIVAALMSYGIAVNLARPLQQRNGALPVIWRALGVAVLLTAPLGVPDVLHAHWTPRAIGSLLALGAFGTAIAYVLTATAAGRLGATAASATTFLIPVVALALGVSVRHEHVAWLSIAGAAVCLAGAWLIRHARIVDEREAARAQIGAGPLISSQISR